MSCLVIALIISNRLDKFSVIVFSPFSIYPSLKIGKFIGFWLKDSLIFLHTEKRRIHIDNQKSELSSISISKKSENLKR